jgi:hypothetical protein
MKSDTDKKILAYIKEKTESTAKELTDYLGISARAVFKQLNKLIENGQLIKFGTPPVVFYALAPETIAKQKFDLKTEVSSAINANFLTLSSQGYLLEGLNGFVYWCEKNNLSIVKTANEYLFTLAKYDKFKHNGLINGQNKIKATFPESHIGKMYYLDFYSIERFGKTKLGTLLLYAKQSQNKKLIKLIVENVKNRIIKLIEREKIDAVGFIPPTVSRKIQFIKELEKQLAIKLPRINIVKASSGIAIPQKTLNKLSDRIANAAQTIFVPDQPSFKNILLIDDAVGSGATFNETARKIKEKKLAKDKVVCLAITGSFKGFDIISEV